jgi:hypothetical protein
MAKFWQYVACALVGVVLGAGYMWIDKNADVTQAERDAALARSHAREASEQAFIELGRRTSTWILSTGILAERDATDHLDRLIGVGYGRGFGDACNELGATEAQCDQAASRAGGLCVDLPDGVCAPPLPGYFSMPNDLARSFRTTYERRVLDPLIRGLCLEVEETERLSADVTEVLERLCGRR